MLRAVSLFAATALLALPCIMLTREAGNIAYLWLPNVVGFVILLRASSRDWPALLLAALAGNVAAGLVYGDPLAFNLGTSLANGVEILLAATLVRRFVLPVGSAPGIQNALQLLVLYVLVAAPVSTLLGALAVRASFDTPLPEVMGNWWLGDTIGVLLLGLPGLLLHREHLHYLRQPRQVADFLLTFMILALVSYLLMRHIRFPFVYAIVAFTAVAFRDGALRAGLHANLVVLTLGLLQLAGMIDLSVVASQTGAKGLWAAAAVTCLFPTLMGMAVENLREQQAAVSSLTERLHLATRSVGMGVWDWNLQTHELHLDSQTQQLYELDRSLIKSELDIWLVRVHPDDRARTERELRAALAGLAEYNSEFRVLRQDGSVRHLHAAALSVRDSQGRVQRLVGLNWDVTQERQAEQALRDARAQLQGVISAASEFAIIATDTQGIITLFSVGAERMLGYQAAELVGISSPAPLHLAEELVTRGLELRAEYGRPIGGFDVFVENARHGKVDAREWTYVRKDRTTLPVKLVVSPISDDQGQITGFLGVAQDITAQKLAQNTLLTTNRVLEHQISVAQRSRQEFESLFALAPGALLVVDAAGHIIKANARAHDQFDYPQGSLLGVSVEDLIPFDRRHRHQQLREEYMQAPAPRLMAAQRVLGGMKRDGTQFLAEITLSPLRLNGMQCTIAIVRDVTEQRLAQEALALAKEQAESASRAKSEFVANMSHEIRTPLNAVLGTAQLLEKLTLNEQQRRYVDMIRSAGQSLLGILNDILDFSKIEAGRMDLARVDFALDEVLANLATLMALNAGDKDIELAIGVAPGTPSHFRGDPLRIQQILVNLVGNAIKFTERGEVVLRVALQSCQGDQAVLAFSVRDTGIGMTPEQQARLFSAFSQADTSMTRRFGGTGLGLVICKRLIELMQGEISLSSSAGVGTEFHFTLRLETPARPVLPPVPAQPDRRVLVVDDNPTASTILTELIRSRGWQADCVNSVDGALALLRGAPDTHPDTLLVDWKLPGADALAHLPASAGAPRRILMVSSYGRERLQNPADQWQGLLVKPITAQCLFDTLLSTAPRRPDGSAGVSSDTGLHGLRVLLVEDNPLNQTVACGLLEHMGALVDVMENGHQAVDWLREHRDDYHVVLMDVQMPVMDGFTATRLIRDELKLDLPVIAMSAGVMLPEQQQCLASGMNDFIGKPIDYLHMRDTIARHTRRGRPHIPDVEKPAAPAPTPVALAAAADPALFAPDRLLGYVRGKPSRLREILAMIDAVIAAGSAPVEEGRRLLAAGQTADAARHFHTLKGSLGNLGAAQACEIAQQLEQAIKADQRDQWESLLGEATLRLDAMAAAARAWLQAHPDLQAGIDPAAPRPTDTGGPDPARLQELRLRLAENNIVACELYARLRDALASQLDESCLARLDRAVQQLDFHTARQLLPEA
ncbi:MAG: PAS domain S-box protein [Gammaproteobacteria bacterium]|nr:PAS domain S-box protein [Gammaproteobacteria bacterium]